MDIDLIATPTAREVLLEQDQDVGLNAKREFDFFSSIKLKNGVTKMTDRNRMRDVDKSFCALLPRDEPLNILDVGVSSGITTVELCQALESKSIVYRMTGMDSDITAFLLVFPDNRAVLVDKTGYPIHFEIRGRGFGYVKGTNVRHRIERKIIGYRSSLFLRFRGRGVLDEEREVTRVGGVRIHRIKLVCSELLHNPFIELMEESVFSESLRGKYDVVRAANFLNRSYFSDTELQEALNNLKRHLAVEGFLWICRTQDSVNRATLFKLGKDNGFEIVSRFGEGSELESLIGEL